MLSRWQTGCRPTRRPTSACHVHVGGQSKAGRKTAANRSVTRFELSRHVEIAQTCLQQVGNQTYDLDSVMEFGLMQVTDRLELSRQAQFELVRDLVCHWILQWNLVFKSHELVPRELDSIAEYGLKNWQTGQLADSTTKRK